MPPSQQTSVNLSMTEAIKGLVINPLQAVFGDALNEEASAQIQFGVMVKQGSADDGALLQTVASNVLKGIVCRNHAYAQTSELGTTGLKPDVVMPFLKRGEIWVWTEETISSLDDAVRTRAVAAGNENAGDFRTTADTTDCILISKFARWASTRTGAGLVRLWIDMLGEDHAVADT